MQTEHSPGPQRKHTSQQLTVLELMLLIAGVALGIWLVLEDLREIDSRVDWWLVAVIGVLGGFSVVGPPLLLAELRHRRGLWSAGKVLWFSQGMASWLLWPPVIYSRMHGHRLGDTTSGVCYLYGTPLMAIYVTTALLAGGWMGGRRRRFRRRSWREQFGLLLGLLWACTGFYVLYLFYREDFGR